jgi:hypothetical protein
VSLDPTRGDFTSLQAALAALPPAGGKIFVKAGNYPTITTTLKIPTNNVQIQGEGMGATVLIADASMTATPILEAYNPAVGVARALMADTARGDTTLTVSPADAASFSAGDYVLLYSNKSVDSEVPGKQAGEVKRITSVDGIAGKIQVDDQIFDAYTVADAAHIIRITVLHNITLSDLSITTNATSSTLNVGFTHFRFIDNLTIDRIEVHDAFFSGIHLQSVINSTISDCYIHHIRDVTTIPNERYGIVVGCASQNVSITGCRFSHTRHAVTTGGSGGTNLNGVQRSIVVANCTSMLSDTAHFDTHEPAENVTFTGCMAIGGIGVSPTQPEVVGFQMRARNGSIVNCSVLQAVGRGIMIFGPVSSGAVIADNMIANVAAINGAGGVGIYLSSPPPQAVAGTSNHSIIGNVIKNCDGSAIGNGGLNNDLVICNNVIENVNRVVPGPAIHLTNAAHAVITGNTIGGGATPAVIAPADAVIVNNTGYNPVGSTGRPWPPSSGDLTNQVSGGNPAPQSGTVYTVRQSPKTIIVAGASVTAIAINGIATGLKAGVFKLGIGESIAIAFTGSPPTTAVYAE